MLVIVAPPGMPLILIALVAAAPCGIDNDIDPDEPVAGLEDPKDAVSKFVALPLSTVKEEGVTVGIVGETV